MTQEKKIKAKIGGFRGSQKNDSTSAGPALVRCVVQGWSRNGFLGSRVCVCVCLV